MPDETQISEPPTEFRLLAKELKKHGFTYVQEKRASTVALYAVKSEFGGTLGYEVVRIKIAPAVFLKVNSTWIPERETYPSDEEFGTRGWFWPTSARALAEARYDRECLVKLDAN